MDLQIHATGANGKTLDEFAEILRKRMVYLNETARGSVSACALDALRSIRARTLVAKANKIKPSLKIDSSLYPSYFSEGGKRRVCLRHKGSKTRYNLQQGERLVLAQTPTRGIDKLWRVWRFVDEYAKGKTQYLLAAPNSTTAKTKAKDIIRKRAMRYAGLAKRALSMLMQKTFTGKGTNDNVSPNVTAKANETTRKTETVKTNPQTSGGTYTLALLDELKYALDASGG